MKNQTSELVYYSVSTTFFFNCLKFLKFNERSLKYSYFWTCDQNTPLLKN